MFFLALRYLFSKKRQTLLILLGIFLGSTCFVTVSGVMLGFREDIIKELVHNNAHIFINPREEFIEEHSLDKNFYPKDEYQHIFWTSAPSGRIQGNKIENPTKWYQVMQTDKHILAYSPRCCANATFSRGKSEISYYITGCHPAMELKIKDIKSIIQEGNFEDIAFGNNCLAIEEWLAKSLGVKLHQTILVSVGKNSPEPFKIVAIYKSEKHFFMPAAYGLLENIQTLKHTPNQVDEIVVKLHDHTLASSVASTLSILGKEKVESWETLFSHFLKICILQDCVRFISVGLIMLVAGFGIYNVLNMMVLQKRKDVAILRSMGYNSRNILFLFFFQGLLLGVIGTLLGLGFGYLISLYLSTIKLFSANYPLLISFNPNIYLHASLLGLISASTASLLPALSAKRLSPIEIIRSGAE